MTKLSATMRVGFFTKTEEARNSGVFEKAEPALHAALVFVGPDQLLVRQLVRIEHIGGDQEGGFALHRAGESLLIDGHRGLDLPLRPVGCGALARPSWTTLLGMGHQTCLHRKPLLALL